MIKLKYTNRLNELLSYSDYVAPSNFNNRIFNMEEIYDYDNEVIYKCIMIPTDKITIQCNIDNIGELLRLTKSHCINCGVSPVNSVMIDAHNSKCTFDITT
jgi:hypothetical protein